MSRVAEHGRRRNPLDALFSASPLARKTQPVSETVEETRNSPTTAGENAVEADQVTAGIRRDLQSPNPSAVVSGAEVRVVAPTRTTDDVREELAEIWRNNATMPSVSQVPPMPRLRVAELDDKIAPLRAREKELIREGAVLPRKDGRRRRRRTGGDRELEGVARQIGEISPQRNEWVRVYDDADRKRSFHLDHLRAWNPFAVKEDAVAVINDKRTNEKPREKSVPDGSRSADVRPAIDGKTKAKGKKERGHAEHAKKEGQRVHFGGGSRERIQRSTVTRSPEPQPAHISGAASTEPTRDGEVIVVQPGEERRSKTERVKKEIVSPYQIGLNELVAKQREEMPKHPTEEDPKKVFDSYKASLTSAYIVERFRGLLHDLPNQIAVYAALEKIFATDLAHALNFAGEDSNNLHLTPENTDKFYELLFPGEKWQRAPFGFKKIGGITPADIVQINITPEGDAKVARGIHVGSHFHKADEDKVIRDRRDFERLTGRFAAVFIPGAELHLLTEPRRSEPQDLTPGKEATVRHCDWGIKVDTVRELVEHVYKWPLSDSKDPLRLLWLDARRANAPITDSSSLTTLTDRRGSRAQRKK